MAQHRLQKISVTGIVGIIMVLFVALAFVVRFQMKFRGNEPQVASRTVVKLPNAESRGPAKEKIRLGAAAQGAGDFVHAQQYIRQTDTGKVRALGTKWPQTRAAVPRVRGMLLALANQEERGMKYWGLLFLCLLPTNLRADDSIWQEWELGGNGCTEKNIEVKVR